MNLYIFFYGFSLMIFLSHNNGLMGLITYLKSVLILIFSYIFNFYLIYLTTVNISQFLLVLA